jgi:hypothetical protein
VDDRNVAVSHETREITVQESRRKGSDTVDLGNVLPTNTARAENKNPIWPDELQKGKDAVQTAMAALAAAALQKVAEEEAAASAQNSNS